MQKLIITLLSFCFLLLAACIRLYQPDIQQGNIISEPMMQRLSVGMSKGEVINTLGHPLLANTFDDTHWAYVYTFQRRGGEITRRNVDVYFQNGRVSRVERSEGKIS